MNITKVHIENFKTLKGSFKLTLNKGVNILVGDNRVLIYPTKPFLDWLKDNNTEFAETSRSKFYVALTRARHSVAIICKSNLTIDGITNYNPDTQA